MTFKKRMLEESVEPFGSKILNKFQRNLAAAAAKGARISKDKSSLKKIIANAPIKI